MQLLSVVQGTIHNEKSKAAFVTKKYHYKKELEHPAVAKEMETKSDCNVGKSGLQLKATPVVTKAVSKANEVASKRNAGNAVESGEAKAA